MKGLTVIGASAGSGKTHRLTEEVVAALDSNSEASIPTETLVAVTFTRRADAELRSRVRRTLLGRGQLEAARALPLAYLGTTHAVAHRLVDAFAVEAGLAPGARILPNEESLLRTALDRALDPFLREELDAVGRRLSMSGRDGVSSWLQAVREILSLARDNRMGPDDLRAMRSSSIQGLRALRGARPWAEPFALDQAFDVALERAETALVELLAATPGRGAKGIADALEQVRAVRLARRRGWACWADWARMTKIEGPKVSEAALGPLRSEAARGLDHPELWADLAHMITLAFEAAARTLSAFSQEKARRRVVDYGDLLERALTVVERADLAPRLAERIRMVVVDEFQDTTPLQLALFIRLHTIVGRSVWVGDAKQCIYGFAGADPLLMDAVLRWHHRGGGESAQLTRNYRSRPALVQLVNDVFGGAFEALGVDPSLVRVEPAREELGSGPPALGLLFTQPPNDAETRGIAEGVSRLLKTHAPEDVAVLVRSNAEAARIAAALTERAIPVDLARTGLARTPEATLLLAALDWLLDADRAAGLVLDALLGGFDGAALGAWMDATFDGDLGTTRERSPRARVAELRARLVELSPREVVDELLHALDAANLARRWPDPGQRLANLEVLRQRAREFEAESGERSEAPTLRSFRDWLREAEAATHDSDGGREAARTAHPAVTVLTYHRAKGLEWPVVVLASLHDPSVPDPFSVVAEAKLDGAFEPDRPLEGRWLRFWLWPFGRTECDELSAWASASEEGRRAAARERQDRLRLLYVGFTRARDRLLLVVRDHRRRDTAWLDELTDAQGRPLLALPPKPTTEGTLVVTTRDGRGGEQQHLAEVWLSPGDAALARREHAREEARVPVFERAPPAEHPPYSILPSNAERRVELTAGASLRIHSGLARGFTGAERVRVGDAVHAFFASDSFELDTESRLDLARRIAVGFGLVAVPPADLVRAADALHEHTARRWGPATWHREVPIERVLDPNTPRERTVRGVIDLLLETAEGAVILDHKTADLPEDRWVETPTLFGAQLAHYADTLRASGQRVRGLAVHLVLAGGLVELREPGESCPTC